MILSSLVKELRFTIGRDQQIKCFCGVEMLNYWQSEEKPLFV